MAEVSIIDPKNFEFQDYNSQDTDLIASFEIDTTLISSSCVEFFVFDINRNVLNSTYDYNNYSVTNDSPSSGEGLSQFSISPGQDALNNGYGNGQYNLYYNFLNKRIGDYNTTLYISEISSDRTEIRLDSNFLDFNTLIDQTEDFIDFRESQNYFVDFFINFGNNQLIISNNIKLEDEQTSNPTVLVKLYEPLPDSFNLKDQVWVVTEFSDPQAFNVANTPGPVFQPSIPFLQGPNFAIPIKSEVNNSSQNLSYNDIVSGASTGSQNQINSLLSQSAINISVDYENFSNFIHFSSAETRIENFYYKVGLIETYTSQSNSLINVTGSSTSQLIFDKKTSNIITNFDKFEYFMYYSSGSTTSYPKSNSLPPYNLYSTSSSEVLTWLGSTNENSGNYGGLLLSASNFDNENPDQLLKTIPEYLREDPANQPYDLFVDMVAQYYDNVWLYTKDITQKYNADNRLDFGVSKDLVSDAIKDFGVKLYQNNFSNQELYTAFLGITPGGSLFPFPEITGSMPVPTGFEFVDTLISASNDVISMDDTNKSLYKRLYHNIPYLLKSKGTTAGLRALITSYGIPDTILRISEFGGKDQVNANDYDLYFNNFNYALKVGPEANYISSSFLANPSWNSRPQTVEFRFKPEKLTTTTSPYGLTNLSQSLFTLENEFGTPQYLDIVLEYSGSGLSTGSYSGAPKDPNYQYGNLKLIPNTGNPSTSASISLPFFNGDWWSVMLTSNLSTGLTLSTGNKIYNGNDGTSLGFYNTASILASNPYSNSNKSYFSTGSLYPGFSGSLQEVRYYKPIISQSVFKDYIMNPLSFEGNGVNSAPDQLIFRAALGSELDINTNTSIHPKVTGSWTTTSSFGSNSNFYFNNTPLYFKNTEYFFLDQPAVGIKNRITDKIRSESDTIPSGSVLSPIRSLSQTVESSASYTDNINYLEVAFSPQNQINDDIIGQMGHFNIGDYIGDPRQRSSSAEIYPDLNNLNEEYFQKYIKQYDLVDFVRLIKFFDNSLFKMIKDFIPVRTSLASGLVIKQHLLERNKYPQPQVSREELLKTGSIKSQRIWDPTTETFFISSSLIESFNGGAAGSFNPFNISYNLDYFSGSTTTNFIVSASGANNILESELTLGDTFISGSQSNPSTFPLTNAGDFTYFDTFTPNLWVEIQDSIVDPLDYAFNSGSKPAPDTDVSGSGILSSGVGNNTLVVGSSNANTSNGIEFSKFQSEGHIQTNVAIFNDSDGNVLTDKSLISSLGASQIITSFTTQSVSTNVSASGRFGTAVDNNTFNFIQQITNVNGGVIANFSDFAVSSFISASEDIFLNPNTSVNSDKSMITDIQSTNLSTEFVTSSILTDVSASGAITFNQEVGGALRFTIGANESNVDGGDMTNFQEFKNGGYITTTNPIFSGSGVDSQIASASVSQLATGAQAFRINGELSPVITQVSGSGALSKLTYQSTTTTLTISPDTTNVTGNKAFNFQEFKDGGYVTTTNPIFSGSAPNTAINSASISTLVDFSNFSVLTLNAVPSSILTDVSMSGNFDFVSLPADRLILNSSQFNASDRGFFDNTTSYISASNDGSQGAEFQSPFKDNLNNATNIAPISSTNNATYIIIDTSGGYSKNPAANNFTFNFEIISDDTDPSSTSFISSSLRPDILSEAFVFRTGSISQGTAGSTTFNSSSIRTSVTNEPFTFRTGSISQGTAGSTTFVSSSARNTNNVAYTIHTGSFDGSETFTNLGTTYISESARNLNGVTFDFHTGSIDGGGNTTFISESLLPLSHSRAPITNIRTDNVMILSTDWSISSIGASSANSFKIFDTSTGSNNTFASSSTQTEFRQIYNDLTPTPLFPNVTQSYYVSTPSILGPVTNLHDSQDEFYNGELSGSNMTITNGELNPGCEPFKVSAFIGVNYKIRTYSDTITGQNENNFLNNSNNPLTGYISTWYGDEPGTPLAPIIPQRS